MLALMSEIVEFLRVEIARAGPVTDEGVVVPAIPQAENHFGELDGTVVALAMLEMFLAAEIIGLCDICGGDDIPARAAVADMVERRVFARNVIRLIVASGGGRDQADMLGHRSNRRQQCDRLEIGHILRPAAQRLEVAVSGGECIGEKHQVELAALSRLRELDIMFDIGACVDLCLWMQPGGDVMAGRMEEGAELHLAAAARTRHRMISKGVASAPSGSLRICASSAAQLSRTGVPEESAAAGDHSVTLTASAWPSA